jgi:hypothetical protein
MTSELNEYRARQIVRTMHRLRGDVNTFAIHAKTLRMSSRSLDGLPLLEEADRLLKALMASRQEFNEGAAQTKSLKRSLSSIPRGSGEMPPAAKWGNEFCAGAKQFAEAVQKAEKELAGLYAAANEKMNSPTRTPTGTPENLLDILMNFIDALSRWIESRKK